MIIDEIKKANIEALKARDNVLRAVYGVVINKYMQATINARAAGTTVDDAEMTRIIQKTIKELEEEAENYKKIGNTQEAENITKQRDALSNYLPKMMSEQEIKQVILGLPDKSVPFVMKHFKANFNGKCDMATVSKVLKSL